MSAMSVISLQLDPYWFSGDVDFTEWVHGYIARVDTCACVLLKCERKKLAIYRAHPLITQVYFLVHCDPMCESTCVVWFQCVSGAIKHMYYVIHALLSRSDFILRVQMDKSTFPYDFTIWTVKTERDFYFMQIPCTHENVQRVILMLFDGFDSDRTSQAMKYLVLCSEYEESSEVVLQNDKTLSGLEHVLSMHSFEADTIRMCLIFVTNVARYLCCFAQKDASMCRYASLCSVLNAQCGHYFKLNPYLKGYCTAAKKALVAFVMCSTMERSLTTMEWNDHAIGEIQLVADSRECIGE